MSDERNIGAQVEAKYPALLFKQQLDAFVQKIFPMLRDNVKKEITPQLAACIHAPRAVTTRSRRGAAPPQQLADSAGSPGAAATAGNPLATPPPRPGAPRSFLASPWGPPVSPPFLGAPNSPVNYWMLSCLCVRAHVRFCHCVHASGTVQSSSLEILISDFCAFVQQIFLRFFLCFLGLFMAVPLSAYCSVFSVLF